jgi:hemerythrin-like domain-containing protein
MNALVLLKQDHGNLDALFRRFEELGSEAVGERAEVRDKILEHLATHALIEETIFYPAIRERIPDIEADVLEALEEHHVAKLSLSELEKLPAGNERFVAKMTVLIESVRHHVEEEEEQLFAKVRDAFSEEELQRLGERMQEAKTVVPKRAHPFVPDVPPFNLILGPPLAVLDKVVNLGRDAVTGVLRRAS